jgi:hypothetical protein
MEFNYGFTIFDSQNPDTILHFVGFEKPPSSEDWKHIIEELQTDPEFTPLLDQFDWEMRLSTPDEIEYFREVMCEAAGKNEIRYKDDTPEITRH